MEQLEKTISTPLSNIAKAFRTGQKGLVDATKSMKLYNEVYNHTVRAGKKDPREIQAYITKWCRKDLQDNVVATKLKQIPAGEEGDTIMFATVAEEYRCFEQIVKMIKLLFSQTDKSVSSKTQVDPKNAATASSKHFEPLSLSQASALKAFYDVVFQPVEVRLRNSIFDQLDKIRDGNANVDQSAIRSATSLFERIAKVLCVTAADRESVYLNSFVRPYFDRVRSRAHKDYHEFGRSENYVAFLLERRSLESDLARLCLNAVVARGAVEVYDDAAVASRFETILKDPQFGLEAYLDQERFNSHAVSNLYKLFYKMTPTSEKITGAFCQAFGRSVLRDMELLKKQWSESTNIDSEAALANRVMEDVLALYKRKVLIVKHEFAGNVSLDRQRHTSLVQSLNPAEAPLVEVPSMMKKGRNVVPSFKFPQLLSRYVDHTLRELSKSGTNNADETVWADPISHLFAMVSEKDVFSDYYKLSMARRLLGTYVDDNERAVLSRLQRQCGKVYTHKFEGMMNDINQASQLQSEFVNAYPASAMADSGGCEFHPKILTFAYWPQVRPDDTFVSPKSLLACQEIFVRFFHRRNPTKQLRWQAERGTSVLTIAFPRGTKEVNCSIHQAAVLMAVDANALSSNPQNGISLAQIAQNTGLDVALARDIIASVYFPKNLDIVRRLEHSRDSGVKLAENHVFDMNPNYHIKVRKITCAPVVRAVGSGSGGSHHASASDEVSDKQIIASRNQMIEAAIVVLMKSRKELRGQEIINLVIEKMTRFFPAQPRMVKQRIEELIGKEYLERDEQENDLFRYLA